MSDRGLKEVREMTLGERSELSKRCLVCKSPNLTELEAKDERKSLVEKYRPSPRFAAHELTSTLKGFARQLGIEGVEGYSPQELMEEVRPEVLRIMRDNG